MNYYAARQHKDTGLWKYTVENDGLIREIGLCADGCQGHKTADEANEHYKQYLLSTLSFSPQSETWPKYKCSVVGCQSEATSYANVEGATRNWLVCESHATRESIEAMLHVGESVSSY